MSYAMLLLRQCEPMVVVAGAMLVQASNVSYLSLTRMCRNEML